MNGKQFRGFIIAVGIAHIAAPTSISAKAPPIEAAIAP